MDAAALEGGFTNPPTEAALAFRALMNVMARPGMIETLSGATPPAPISMAAGTLLLTLADPETPIYLAKTYDTPEVRSWISFHTGAPTCDPGQAVFALAQWDDLMPLSEYPTGTPQYPDRSATLIVEMPALDPSGTRLSGPGIRDIAELSLPDPEILQQNHALFPMGLDFYFTCDARVAALPRSTRVG